MAEWLGVLTHEPHPGGPFVVRPFDGSWAAARLTALDDGTVHIIYLEAAEGVRIAPATMEATFGEGDETTRILASQ
jgi:hypothetical protein